MSAPHNAKDLLSGGDEEPDPAEFGNPDAWGFCKYCAFDVAVQTEDPFTMLDHKRTTNGWGMKFCPGGGCVPTVAPGKEAAPVPPPELEEEEDE